MIGALADPQRHFGRVAGCDRRVGHGRHPAVLDAVAVDEERRDAAADADGQPVPDAVRQPEAERLDARKAQVRVVQPDLILAPTALHLQEPAMQ